MPTLQFALKINVTQRIIYCIHGRTINHRHIYIYTLRVYTTHTNILYIY